MSKLFSLNFSFVNSCYSRKIVLERVESVALKILIGHWRLWPSFAFSLSARTELLRHRSQQTAAACSFLFLLFHPFSNEKSICATIIDNIFILFKKTTERKKDFEIKISLEKYVAKITYMTSCRLTEDEANVDGSRKIFLDAQMWESQTASPVLTSNWPRFDKLATISPITVN